MHNDSKLDYENRALHMMLSKDSNFRGYTLESHRDRPDFIIGNGIERVGVEHCCIDTISSRGRENTRVTFSNFKDKRRPNSMHRLLDANLDVWDKYQCRIEDFNSDIFGILFLQTCMDHGYQAVGELLKDGTPKLDAYRPTLDVNRMGLLCEVLIPDCDYLWTVMEMDGRIHRQRIKGLPMTLLTILTIAMVASTFDFVTFVVIPYENHDYSVHTYTYADVEHMHYFAGFTFGQNDLIAVSAAFLDDKGKERFGL